ncbi:MAG: porin [candidate division Zixibacteria bacterium]|nr:porin [candidate division Zixibacteria bacterium]
MQGYLANIVIVVLLVLTLTGTAIAQDFQQLLGAVDRVESNLKALIDKEASARSADIAKLRKELTGQTVGAPADSNPVFGQFRRELDSLRAEVSMLSASRQQLASADPEGVTVATSTAGEIAELTEGLTALNVRLESYVNSNLTPPEAELAKTENVSDQSALSGIKLSGFVNASAIDDRNTDRSTFGLDETELDIEHGFSDKATVRADIEFVNDGAGGLSMDLEQGYLSYSPGFAQRWTFSFGKFNAPMGVESCDAPGRYQHSYAAISSYALPANLTGASLSTQFSPAIDAIVYLVNGWDVNSDNNSGKTWGTRWGFTPIADLNFGLSAVTGPEQADRTDSRRSVFDLDLTYQITPTFLFGGEVNYGMESKVLTNGEDAKWFGFLLMSNIGLSGNINLTMRADYLKDNNGHHTGYSQDLKAFTIAPRLKIVDGLEGLVEMKYEFSNHEVFYTTSGAPKPTGRLGPVAAPMVTGVQKDNRLSLAAEMTYSF